MSMTQYLHKALIVPIFVTLGGCSAMGDSWPSLAGDPPVEPVALLDPVRMPSPSPLYHSMTTEDAHILLDALPDLVADLEKQISSQYKSYRESKTALGQDKDDRMAGTTHRTAEFQLSRLSRLETELSRLLRRAQSMTAALTNTPSADRAQALTDSLRKQTEELSDFLVKERLSLAHSTGR